MTRDEEDRAEEIYIASRSSRLERPVSCQRELAVFDIIISSSCGNGSALLASIASFD